MSLRETPEQREERRAKRREADRLRYATDPKRREADKLKARKYYQKMVATRPGLMRRRWTKYQARNRNMQWYKDMKQRESMRLKWLRRNDEAFKNKERKYREHYYYNVLKMRILDSEESFDCQGGCGRRTLHPTGHCKGCRTSTCRKCKKNFFMEYMGQRVHLKCMPNATGMAFEGV